MTGRQQLRRAGWRVAPATMAERARDYERRLRLRNGVVDLAERFVAAHGPSVLGGPVAGLELPTDRLAEVDAPTAKLLGTYEQEIHPALEAALAARPKRFANLGSADGYFAVGIARAAQIPVDAFDIAASARDLTGQLADLNGVTELMSLHKQASRRSVLSLDLDGALMLCDIDGPERNLFDDSIVEALCATRVIIELHTLVHHDVESVLNERFSATHDVEVVHARPRNPDDHEALKIFTEPGDRDHAINELLYRFDGLRWAVMTPISATS